MAVSELPGNPNAVWTVRKHVEGERLSHFSICILHAFFILLVSSISHSTSLNNCQCPVQLVSLSSRKIMTKYHRKKGKTHNLEFF